MSLNGLVTLRTKFFFATSELEQSAALKYLYQWLRNHPKYGTLSPAELSGSLYYADVSVIIHELHIYCLMRCSSFGAPRFVAYIICQLTEALLEILLLYHSLICVENS